MHLEQYKIWMNQENLEAYLKEQLQNLTEAEIEDAFYRNLEFGTGGMRGVVGPGTNRMNIYTIRKANVGFAKYLLNLGEHVKEQGVVIAYDCRHFSPEFAMESAKVLATYGIKAYIFESLRPTPELSFAVRYLKAAGGIVVTASHNPPEYNGYKLYDESGCQLVPHQGDQVIELVEQVQDIFAINVKSEEELKAAGLIEIIGDEIDTAYINAVKTLEINPNCNKKNLKIVFSPLHGTANVPVRRVLTECGYEQLNVVEAQCAPDPNFSTVASPNPEETSAFEMAIKMAKEINADIVMATDPDADRVGLAVKNPDGEYVLLTGNQTGAILIHYILSQKKAQGTLPAKGKVFNTIVTSDMGAKIARAYGFEVISTLTGFKFIGEQARLLENTDCEYIFGYEESYGYLIGDFVRDKDSVQSVLMCAEAAAYYKQQGQTLYDVLMELYTTYGCYREDLVTITLKGKVGAEKIQSILKEFRENTPTTIANQKIIRVEDYQASIQTDLTTQNTTDIILPKSNVLKYTLEDGSWFVLRPSGTEPKAKVYIGVISETIQLADEQVKNIKADVLARVSNIIK
ncbi:phospho-sugar mutase [Turicibacter sanguinis]|uniref:phospho-sugar mutase n=1 Tax=Turicibacter sanguinis TaxID=154288 RepID=UPI0018AAF585|nr:phospho-sugar mutase [Turicibacter sanguinis]MDB8558540.1 phospho-sugar mutase [Turicibacter sanguinis]MDB8561336.1 phospho-sugar mutase [Turicibacter sanguinis]